MTVAPDLGEAVRYEHLAPGDMVHIGIKKLGRIHSRLAYTELLPDEKATTATCFLGFMTTTTAGHTPPWTIGHRHPGWLSVRNLFDNDSEPVVRRCPERLYTSHPGHQRGTISWLKPEGRGNQFGTKNIGMIV